MKPRQTAPLKAYECVYPLMCAKFMHILHIYKDYYPVLGGIENHLRVLAEGLAARGHRITVLVTNTAGYDELQHNGNLTLIKAARRFHAASTPLSPRMLAYARELDDVDLIHLQFPYPPGDLVALAVPHRPPLIVQYQSDIVRQQTLLKLYRPLMRVTLDRAACLIASSPEYIVSSPELAPRADKCVVAPLSVDSERFAHPDQALVTSLRERYGPDPILLFVGRLRYYKGLHFLIEAMTHLRYPARLLIAGIGPEADRLRALAAPLGNRVVFLGEISDAELPALYAAANLFVLPSHLRAEAFGIVQLEAQAAGLPVICTQLGTGTSYVTVHGTTGIVVPPADPGALTRAIEVLITNPAMARTLGRAGQVRAATTFSRTATLDSIETIYRTVRERHTTG